MVGGVVDKGLQQGVFVIVELPYPPTVNTYWRNLKGRTVISKAGREYKSKVTVALNGCATILGRLSVEIEAYMPDRRVRDIDNLTKSILDSLTHAGVWGDDSQIDVLKISRMGIEKPGKVIVKIEER